MNLCRVHVQHQSLLSHLHGGCRSSISGQGQCLHCRGRFSHRRLCEYAHSRDRFGLRAYLYLHNGGRSSSCELFLTHTPNTVTEMYILGGLMLRRSTQQVLVEALQFSPPHTAPRSQICSSQFLGEICESISVGPRLQHNHLNSCNHSTSACSTSTLHHTAYQ